MNITKQTPEQVKKDVAAHVAKASMLRNEIGQHLEKKQRLQQQKSELNEAKVLKKQQIEKAQRETKQFQKVEVAVQQVHLTNAEQGISSYDNIVLIQGGDLNLAASLPDHINNSGSASPKTVYTALNHNPSGQQFFNAQNSRQQQQTNYGNNNSNQGRVDQSTHTLDEQDQLTQGSQPNLLMKIDSGYVDRSELRNDPMRALQIKQNSNSPPNKKAKKRRELIVKKTSFIDISPPRGHYNSGSILAGHSSGKSKHLKRSTNSSHQSPKQSPRTPKVPNLDLIEDVSRASQVLPHELMQSHSMQMHQPTYFDHANVQLIAIMDPYDALNAPIAPPVNTAIGQNTAIGFHRGNGANLQYIMNATASSLLPPSTSKTKLSPEKSMLAVTLAGHAERPVAVIAPTVSDEDQFKNERTGISKNSFERASKQYYLHQQKMLKKEQERLRKKEKDAIMQARLRFKNKSNNDSSGEQTNQTDILVDHPQQDGFPGVIVRRSSRDSDAGSNKTSRSPAENRNIEFTPNLSEQGDFRQKGQNKVTPSPNGGRDSIIQNGELSNQRIQRLAATNRFGGSKGKRILREGSDPSENKSSQMRVALENKNQTISSSMFSEQKHQFQKTGKSSKFFQTTNRFGEQEEAAMVIGRQVVPIVSKMRKVNLLKTQAVVHHSPRANKQVLKNFHNASQHSRRVSQPHQHQEQDMAESSVKTIFDSPNVRLVPRPLNFVYQIQQERDLQQLNTADGVFSVDSQNASPVNIQAHYSTDDQIDEEKYGGGTIMENDILGGTLKIKYDNGAPIQVSNFEKELAAKGGKSRQNAIREPGKESRKNSSKKTRAGMKKNPSELNADGVSGIKGIHNDSKKVLAQSRTKVKLLKSKEEINEQQLQLPDRNNEAGSRFSNVMTLKPPSPGDTPLLTNPDKVSQDIVVERPFEASRNGTAETRQIISIESKTRQPSNVLVSSSGSVNNFIELPDNPYLHPSFMYEYMTQREPASLTAKDNAMRQQDPETYLMLFLLKKIQHNPNANVVKEMEKIMISDKEEDFGQLKPLLYRKWKKQDPTKDQFNKVGIIAEESFQFDELQRKRTEFFNYCVKKIHSAIHDEPMPEKDQKKSPLNVQISNSKRRKTQRTMLSDVLRNQYGITFQDDHSKTERLVKGISTVDIKRNQPGIQGLSKPEEIRKFEELNGIKITPEPVNCRNLNDQSQLDQEHNMHTIGLLPKLSQTTWYDQDKNGLQSPPNEIKYQDTESPFELPMAANTNFDFQTNMGVRADYERNRRDNLLKPLHLNYASSGDLEMTERDRVHMMTTSQGFGGLKESKSVALGANINQQSAFKKRFRSLEPSQTQINQIMTLDQTNSRLTFDHGPRSIAQAHTTTNRSKSNYGGMKDFFSSHQRFNTLYMDGGGQTFQRNQVSKHSNPKFIEIIAKMRDPSLNTDYMLKTGIRPRVIEKPKARKMNQKTIDEHIVKNTLDNQGCPLLPIHKMDPIYHQQMLSQLKKKSPRPQEKNWQQLNVMLPILRQNHTTNILKNDQMLVIDPKQEQRCKNRLIQNTMHTPTDLTAPSIFQQTHNAKRYSNVINDQHEHRIKVNDIIAVKKNNERELFEKRWQTRKDDEQHARLVTSKTNQLLSSELDNLAEQMAQDDAAGDALWTANSY